MTSAKHDEATLVIADVHHAYDATPSLRGVSLEVAAGETTCLLGPSGCGKTTLLRLVAGLERVGTGRITIEGTVVCDADSDGGRHVLPEKRPVGMVFQDYALFPHLDADANIAFGLADLSRAARTERVASVLRLVGLDDYGKRYPHQLSGGQRQRVALARALARRPQVLLLDEPFSGLDIGARHRVREQTRDVLRESETTTLLVTHDAEEAMQLGDRIALMRDGTIVQQGSVDDLFFHPRDVFVATFFGETNHVMGIARNGEVTTPLGTFAVGDVEAEADVIVRCEAIRPVEPNDTPKDARPRFRIVESRLLGGRRLTTLRAVASGVGDDNGMPILVRARHDARDDFAVDALVTVDVDPAMVYVFACHERSESST